MTFAVTAKRSSPYAIRSSGQSNSSIRCLPSTADRISVWLFTTRCQRRISTGSGSSLRRVLRLAERKLRSIQRVVRENEEGVATDQELQWPLRHFDDANLT